MNLPDLLWLEPALWVLGGLLAGILVAALVASRRGGRLREQLAAAQTRLKAQDELEAERSRALEAAEGRLASAVDALARQSLKDNNEQFLALARENLGRQQEQARGDLKEREKAIEGLVGPIREALEKARQKIEEIEKERHQAFGGIKSLLETMSRDQQQLSTETRNLVTALRRPEVRGQWGEMTLRRLVELAGMVEHCDFTEQEHTRGPEGSLRPDLIIHLPEERQLVVDVKTPLDAYLAAVEAPDDAAKQACLERHARKVRERVRELASKAYWSQFDRSPEFVILFIPGDQFLSAALAREPGLLDEALSQHVILATPTSLVALLKAVAYGWRQVALAENARQIRDLASELHRRLATFADHLAKVGRSLTGSVDAYNAAVGSLERNVLPGARRFIELGVQAKKDMPDLPAVEPTPRRVQDPGVLPSPDDDTE